MRLGIVVLGLVVVAAVIMVPETEATGKGSWPWSWLGNFGPAKKQAPGSLRQSKAPKASQTEPAIPNPITIMGSASDAMALAVETLPAEHVQLVRDLYLELYTLCKSDAQAVGAVSQIAPSSMQALRLAVQQTSPDELAKFCSHLEEEISKASKTLVV